MDKHFGMWLNVNIDGQISEYLSPFCFCMVTVLKLVLLSFLKILLSKKPYISGSCVKKSYLGETDVAVCPTRKVAQD